MSMLFMAGAEGGNDLEWDAENTAATIAQKRTGAYSFNLSASGFWAQKNISPISAAYLQFGWHMNVAGAATTVPVLRWRSGLNVLGTLAFHTGAQTLRLYTGDMAVLVATGTIPVNILTWYVIEIYNYIADAGGRLTVRVNRIPDPGLDFIGDTKPGADATFDNFYFNTWLNAAQGCVSYIDDIIINDPSGGINNTWPNGLHVVYLRPNAAGASTQWTPSVPPNWQCVDEVPVSQADYVYTNANNQIDLYTLQDLPADAKAVRAVRGDAYAWADGVPVPTQLRNLVHTGGVTHNGTDHVVPNVMALLDYYWEVNPGTALAWTPAEVNALEAGQESRP